jgi:Tfp pilus assembly protein PilF
MPRRDPIRNASLLMAAALGLTCGCSQTSGRPKEHASASILDSGPQPKVTRREAADVEVAVARSAEQQGQFAEAEAGYLAALKKDPKRADAEVRLAILRDRKGDPAAADKHFDRALKLQPKDPEILCDRGYSLYLRRRWAEAEASFQKALALDPAHARSHSNLALVYAQQGDKEKSLAEFARAGCDPSDARANLGLVLAMEGHFEEAKREYALALAGKPGSAGAKEGLNAATVALTKAGKDHPTADPAILRASVPPDR